MKSENYIYLPVSIAVFFQLMVPYLHNLKCLNLWLTPPYIVCIAIFLGLYVIFGILLWKSDDLNSKNGDEIFYLVWGLVFVNLFWIYTYRKYKRISVTLLFAALLLGYFVYNAVFLSELTDNNETRYLNLLSVYIIWIGLMITILIESPDYNLSVST
jgi:hypothetical protein